MADLQDIPRLGREFFDLAKAYLVQETVEPAKKLGYFAGMSVAAAAAWALALVLLSVAGLRALMSALPAGPYWEALAYGAYAVVLTLFSVALVALIPSRGVHDGPPQRKDPT
jgi:hypothetical protein